MVRPDDVDLTAIGKVIADKARASMLLVLMDGQAHTATELASAAGVSASGASAHLRHMREAGLVTMRIRGRQRLHELASPWVAHAIETLAVTAPLLPRAPTEFSSSAKVGSKLRYARACYSHLGGTLAVTITTTLLDDDIFQFPGPHGAGYLKSLDHPLLRDLEIDSLEDGNGPAVRACPDWTERRPHLAGCLGSRILQSMVSLGWLRRLPDSRAMTVSRLGRERLIRSAALPPA